MSQPFAKLLRAARFTMAVFLENAKCKKGSLYRQRTSELMSQFLLPSKGTEGTLTTFLHGKHVIQTRVLAHIVKEDRGSLLLLS